MNLKYLRKIGLAENEIRVYEALIEIGISTMNSIQEKTGIDRRNIYDILNKLIEKGLASYTIEKGKKTFQITHPDKIIDFLTEKKKEIDQTISEVEPKIPDLISAFNETKQEIRAEVYRGKEALKALHEESLQYKKQYWIGGNSSVEYKVDLNMKDWFHHWMKKRAKGWTTWAKFLGWALDEGCTVDCTRSDGSVYGTFTVGLTPPLLSVHIQVNPGYVSVSSPENALVASALEARIEPKLTDGTWNLWLPPDRR